MSFIKLSSIACLVANSFVNYNSFSECNWVSLGVQANFLFLAQICTSPLQDELKMMITNILVVMNFSNWQ